MTPPARTQAAIELLDAIVTAAHDAGAAADTLIARYFAQRRYAGSKDRRAVRELVYAGIRAAGELPPSGRAAMLLLAAGDPALAASFDGSPHAPAPIHRGEALARGGVAPAWLIKALAASDVGEAEQAALLGRAPLDLRVNTLRATVADIAARLPVAEPIAGLPDALRLPAGADVEALLGQVEVQDAGSQFVALAADAQPGQTIVDLCAGAGGKTLALAAAMGNEGRMLACDTDRSRLSRLPQRAARAGVSIVTTELLDPGKEPDSLGEWTGRADTVLVDAPCSGTGTWRRNPEARWRLTPARLERLVELQARLLGLAVPLVRPGGSLVYIVCSSLDEEGVRQIERFTASHRGWVAEPLDLPVGRPRGAGIRLSPAHDDTDGFFVARLRSPC